VSEALEYFFKSYLHEDWEVDHDDVGAVIADFAASDPHQVPGAHDEAAELLSRDLDEGELEAELKAIGLDSYYPPGDDMTYRGFLEVLAERLSGPGLPST